MDAYEDYNDQNAVTRKKQNDSSQEWALYNRVFKPKTSKPVPKPTTPLTYFSHVQVAHCGVTTLRPNPPGQPLPNYKITSNWGIFNMPVYRAESSISVNDAFLKALDIAKVNQRLPQCSLDRAGECCNYSQGEKGVK